MLGLLFDLLRHLKRRNLWTPEQSLGRRGEDLAHRYLRRKGFIVIARNYRLAAGDAEADVIARDGDALVIVEVKTRASGEFGPPERAIGAEKQRALTRIAREYSRKANIDAERVRCDVVTVVLEPAPRLEHLKDAIRVS